MNDAFYIYFINRFNKMPRPEIQIYKFIILTWLDRTYNIQQDFCGLTFYFYFIRRKSSYNGISIEAG